MIRIYIVSAYYREAVAIARIHHLAPTEWCFVKSAQSLRGQRGGVAWLFGNYWERRDIEEINEFLRVLQFRVFRIDDDR